MSLALGLGAGVGAVGLGAAGLATFHRNIPIFGPVIGRGPRDQRQLYLTFDDGPSESATAAILDVLAAHAVPAAFFMVGAHVQRLPGLARRVAEAGHEIGNHTQHHRKLHLRGLRSILAELDTAHTTIASVTGVGPRFFRAPHGFRNPFVQVAVRRRGYTVFGWTLGVWDSARPGADEIRRRVERGLRPGTILLLHDGDGRDPHGDRTQTAQALPGILEHARRAGYEVRPLAELLRT